MLVQLCHWTASLGSDFLHLGTVFCILAHHLTPCCVSTQLVARPLAVDTIGGPCAICIFSLPVRPEAGGGNCAPLMGTPLKVEPFETHLATKILLQSNTDFYAGLVSLANL